MNTDAVERGVKAIQDVREVYRDRPHPASMEEWDATVVRAVLASVQPVTVTEAMIEQAYAEYMSDPSAIGSHSPEDFSAFRRAIRKLTGGKEEG